MSELIPVEFANVFYKIKEESGTLTIQMEGQSIPSLPGITFGFPLRPGTTRKQAEKLRSLLAELSPFFFAGFRNRVKDEEYRRQLIELYDDFGYFDPHRPRGPGDELFPNGVL